MASAEFEVAPVCCGIDVHKKSVTACLLISEGKRINKIHKKFSTMTHDLEELRDWLILHSCSIVTIESTGVFWKPLYNILEDAQIQVLLANARHVKNLPGKKTDMSDAQWLAMLLRNGLIKGSFIPPKAIRKLRDLTRHRTKLLHDRTKIKNRIQGLLEDANIKLSSVASNLFGVSGMEMLTKLACDSNVTPANIASLAKGRLRKKQDDLEKAAYGRVLEHHRIILRSLLDQLQYLNDTISYFEELIRTNAQPYEQQISLLCSIPGVEHNTAVTMVAEIGVDMTVFPTSAHLASWAGVCPGNNESAGKSYSGKLPPGNRHLKTYLCQSAWAASRSRNTYLSKKFWSLKARRGDKKAAVAIAHKILIAAYHILKNMEPYRELGPEYLNMLKGTRGVSKMIRALKECGYEVTAPESIA